MQKTGNELTYDYDFYALNGLLSFLRRMDLYTVVKSPMCQRPKRASFISTAGTKNRKTEPGKVSTP